MKTRSGQRGSAGCQNRSRYSRISGGTLRIARRTAPAALTVQNASVTASHRSNPAASTTGSGLSMSETGRAKRSLRDLTPRRAAPSPARTKTAPWENHGSVVPSTIAPSHAGHAAPRSVIEKAAIVSHTEARRSVEYGLNSAPCAISVGASAKRPTERAATHGGWNRRASERKRSSARSPERSGTSRSAYSDDPNAAVAPFASARNPGAATWSR
jgi:hypothetical protein